MKQSEFWGALELVFGPVLGRSLAQDLYLPSLGGTAEAALENGEKADLVWEALIKETGQDEKARWIHRRPPRRSKA